MEQSFTAQIARAADGERDAAEHVVRRVGRLVLPLATAVLGERDAAADVTQDVAVDVLRGLPRLRDPERFDFWVRRIAVRRVMATAGERRRRRSAETALTEATEPSYETDGAGAVALREALRAALGSLPTRQRLALALRYVHGLTEAEVAETLGCPPGTAAALLSRGRALLRRDPTLAALAPSSPKEVCDVAR